jgi:hypothetical protein
VHAVLTTLFPAFHMTLVTRATLDICFPRARIRARYLQRSLPAIEDGAVLGSWPAISHDTGRILSGFRGEHRTVGKASGKPPSTVKHVIAPSRLLAMVVLSPAIPVNAM